jgi:hypothetical protein
VQSIQRDVISDLSGVIFPCGEIIGISGTREYALDYSSGPEITTASNIGDIFSGTASEVNRTYSGVIVKTPSPDYFINYITTFDSGRPIQPCDDTPDRIVYPPVAGLAIGYTTVNPRTGQAGHISAEPEHVTCHYFNNKIEVYTAQSDEFWYDGTNLSLCP